MAWNQHKDATARRLDNSQGNSFYMEVVFFYRKIMWRGDSTHPSISINSGSSSGRHLLCTEWVVV